MSINTDYQSSTTNATEAYSDFGTEKVSPKEGRLGANTICTQPQDRKTLKILNRVHNNVRCAKEVSLEPKALEVAGYKAKEQITRTRIRNGFTPVPNEIAPESIAIAALRARLL